MIKTFRQLTPEETKEFRQSARENYTPLQDIKGVFHPVYQLECVLMNIETQLITSDREAEEQKKECQEFIQEILTMPHEQFLELLSKRD